MHHKANGKLEVHLQGNLAARNARQISKRSPSGRFHEFTDVIAFAACWSAPLGQ